MKIAESTIQTYSERTSLEQDKKRESLTVWDAGGERRTVSNDAGLNREINVQQYLSSLNQATKVVLSEEAMKSRPVKAIAEPLAEEDPVMADLNIRILTAMIERLTGKKVKILSPEAFQVKDKGEKQGEAAPAAAETTQDTPAQGGLIYDYYESHYEYESTSFDATGTIITEDGKQIDFSVTLNMSREFLSEERINIRAGDALKDPLVVNFSGLSAELSQSTFAFDIDSDGRENQISFLKPGSGFLALDKNDDQVINDGSELFGPQSGNGFQDLARYDQDGNQWIDENDDVYSKLRIWTKDAEGNDKLFALGEKGIGAIYLGSTASQFSLKDAQNSLLGEVRSTGLFVREDGQVGTVQQIDFVA